MTACTTAKSTVLIGRSTDLGIEAYYAELGRRRETAGRNSGRNRRRSPMPSEQYEHARRMYAVFEAHRRVAPASSRPSKAGIVRQGLPSRTTCAVAARTEL